ncbi:hypothetical protein ACI6QG_13420 [Roseococcus sp. DSY-14]
MRCIAALLLAMVVLPAQAQQRVVVVPAEAAVAVPARGAAAPPMVAATRPRLTRQGREGGRVARAPSGGDVTVQNLAVPALIGLPLLAAAGAATAAAVANGGAAGGGAGTAPGVSAPASTSAPVRTR